MEILAPPGLLQPLLILQRIWTNISMYFIDGPPNSLGKSTIMVVVDHLSKYVHFIVIAHPYNASQIAQLFVEYAFKLYGMPASIISNHDPLFTSTF